MPGSPPEIRFVCFAPSPHTERHDALRAGMGIFRLLAGLIERRGPPLETTFCDAAPAVEDASDGAALLRGAAVLVAGCSTWALGVRVSPPATSSVPEGNTWAGPPLPHGQPRAAHTLRANWSMYQQSSSVNSPGGVSRSSMVKTIRF